MQQFNESSQPQSDDHSDFTDYTNGELVQLFDPRNDELPFVYDDMATMLDHCPDAPKKTDVKLI